MQTHQGSQRFSASNSSREDAHSRSPCFCSIVDWALSWRLIGIRGHALYAKTSPDEAVSSHGLKLSLHHTVAHPTIQYSTTEHSLKQIKKLPNRVPHFM